MKTRQDQNPYRPPTADQSTGRGKISWIEVKRWSMFGAASGADVPTFFVLVFVIATVASGVREQGQLYHEDGPVGFFFLSFVLWLLFVIPSAAIGAGVGAFIGLFHRIPGSNSKTGMETNSEG